MRLAFKGIRLRQTVCHLQETRRFNRTHHLLGPERSTPACFCSVLGRGAIRTRMSARHRSLTDMALVSARESDYPIIVAARLAYRPAYLGDSRSLQIV